MAETQDGTKRAGSTAQGCSLMSLLILSTIWVLGGTGIAQLFTWSLEQALLESTFELPDVRWMISLAYGLILFVALLIVTLWTRMPKMKAVFRTWTLAAFLAVILAPARLLPITAAQPVAIYQILGLLIYILGLWLLLARPARLEAGAAAPGSRWRGVGLALLIAAAVGLPWVLIGALGSPLDTLLNLLVGLLFGAAAGILLAYSLLPDLAVRSQGYTGVAYGSDGFAAAIALLILVTGLGQNGIQWSLALVVPVLGWAVVAVAVYGSQSHPSNNWPSMALLVGLAAAWPLMLVDPDELSVIVTGPPGELIGWVARAGQYSLWLALLAGLLFAFVLRHLLEAAPFTAKHYLSVAGAWLVLAVVFFVWGQPGFHGDRIFVILTEQADLSQAAGIEDYNQRRASVYHALVEHADATQADIRLSLDRWGIGYTPYYLENGLEVQASPLIGLWLERRPEVDRILYNPYLRPLPGPIPESRGSDGAPVTLAWNLDSIRAEEAWDLGARGEGIVIGQSDSGVQFDHPELSDSYRGRTGGDDYNWLDPWFGSQRPNDFSGHGTHTLATAAGNRVGVAPDATWIGCMNMARNMGNPALYLDCLQFMLAPYPQGGDPLRDGDPARGAHVLNNSWGCPPLEGCDHTVLAPALSALRSAGIFVVVSAGNSGNAGCETVTDPPAIYPAVYSVGAVDPAGNLAVFSSIGPVTVDGSSRMKPELVAPGVEVLSAYPNSTYARLSGTSMAAPHVTGTVALMWSANPGLIGNIERTEEILNQTARSYTGPYPECVIETARPNPAAGYGVLDAAAAVEMALEE